MPGALTQRPLTSHLPGAGRGKVIDEYVRGGGDPAVSRLSRSAHIDTPNRS